MADFKLLDARPQARLNSSPFHEWRVADGRLCTEFYRVETGYLLRFPDLADFEVSTEGLNVTCFPAPHVLDESLEHLYLNQVLPLVLGGAGKLVFHASAVEVADSAIAFVAESGRGKSTLAANFAVTGYRLLSDDGLVLEQCDHGYLVIPSHPSVRLWEDSQKTLVALNIDSAPHLHFTTKTRFLAGPGLPHCDQPRPLRTVYFLGDGGAQDIVFRRLSAAETVIEWTKHSFLLDIEDRSVLAAHFDRMAALANMLPCYHLDYPRRFEDLNRLLKAILDQAASESLAA